MPGDNDIVLVDSSSDNKKKEKMMMMMMNHNIEKSRNLNLILIHLKQEI